MSRRQRGDALVFFGATGDLAFRQIFPALQRMAQAGDLDVPIIGVARATGTSRSCAPARATASRPAPTELDPAAFERLGSLMRYVGRRLRRPATFAKLREALGDCERPLHYLAIPPSLFATVVEHLGRPGSRSTHASSSRSRSAATSRSAQELNRDAAPRVPRGARLPDRPLPRQGAGPEPPLLPLRQRVPRADLEPRPRQPESRSRWPRTSASRGAARSTRASARSATSSRTTSSRC